MAVTPVFVATWRFGVEACQVGLALMEAGGSALDAVEKGANAVEENPDVLSVGYGGLPNAEGVLEMDAAIMDGPTHAAGAVAGIVDVRRPISVARRVMEETPHVMLVGENALRFAVSQGFERTETSTPASRARYSEWLEKRSGAAVSHFDKVDPDDHDTVGVCALDAQGNLAAGCTTSGLAWKTPGRVGDTPVIGSGLYVDNEVGAAAATGNGDEIMKVCLSFRVVRSMEDGMAPRDACIEAIRYLLRKRPAHQSHGASVICVAKDGQVGSASTQEGFDGSERAWQYAVGCANSVALRDGTYVTA